MSSWGLTFAEYLQGEPPTPGGPLRLPCVMSCCAHLRSAEMLSPWGIPDGCRSWGDPYHLRDQKTRFCTLQRTICNFAGMTLELRRQRFVANKSLVGLSSELGMHTEAMEKLLQQVKVHGDAIKFFNKTVGELSALGGEREADCAPGFLLG